MTNEKQKDVLDRLNAGSRQSSPIPHSSLLIPHSVSGIALHTGVPSTVRVTPRPDDGLGIRFFFPGFPEGLTASAWSTLQRSSRRATVLEDARGARIRTPEHLLAAALFFADEPLDVHCDREEIPGLDGSARPWFTALAAAASKPSPKPAYAADGWEYSGPEGSLRAEPAEGFSVEYMLERGGVRQRALLTDAHDAPAEILPARTFIFWEEWTSISLRGAKSPAVQAGDSAASLLAGAGQGSGMLLASSPEEFQQARIALPELARPDRHGNLPAFPLLHPASFRMPDEAARHKVLDLLGDLALNGLALPKLRLTVTNGGHALNHLLLDALRKQAPERTHTIPKKTGEAA